MPFTLSRDEVRAKLLAYKSQFAKKEKIDIPWIPEFNVVKDEAGNIIEDNRPYVREMMGDESVDLAEEQKKDSKRAFGRVIAKCLLMPDGSMPIFNETDLQVVITELGDSVLTPILTKIQAFSSTQEQAAKNLPTTPPSGSTTS